MEVMILEQEAELKNTENQMKEMTNEIKFEKKWNQPKKKKKIEMESLNKKIKIISNEINNKKRKLSNTNLILSNVVGETNSYFFKINNLKKKVHLKYQYVLPKNVN